MSRFIVECDGVFIISADWLGGLTSAPMVVGLKMDTIEYYHQICEAFDQIEEIQTTIVFDKAECPFPKIRFNVKSGGSIENILEQKREFAREVCNSLSLGSRKHFVLVIQPI